MILIVTNTSDATADFLLPILIEHGLSIFRLDTHRILEDGRIESKYRHPMFDQNGQKKISRCVGGIGDNQDHLGMTIKIGAVGSLSSVSARTNVTVFVSVPDSVT